MNHRYYKIAAPLIYENLTVRFSDYASLQRIVTEIEGNPLRRQYLIHARRLNLMAIPTTIQQYYMDDDLRPTHTDFPEPDQLLRPKDLIHDTFGSPGFFFERYLTQLSNPGINDILLEPGFYKEKDWRPLISLIANITHLTEFHYILANMFPKCLLQVIHDHHPTCRLSIWGWQRLGLPEPGLEGVMKSGMPEFDDPFEMDLLKSPCLHAISLYHNSGRLRHSSEWISECIFPLITMAPNLKYVYLRNNPSKGEDLFRSNQRWSDYITSMNPIYTAAPISLTFINGRYFDLLEWSKLTDFSSLRSLSLDISIPRGPLEFMACLSGLKNLECLCLNLSKDIRPPPNFEDELRTMFAGLNPLRYLRIRGTRDTCLVHEIFAHHGETLRGFILEPLDRYRTFFFEEEKGPLYPVFNHHDITALAEHAPHLEELRLPIQRSKGDIQECQLYEALGKFPSIRNLILDLDCNPCERLDEDQATYPGGIRQPRIWDIFSNAAMDETLARAIWDVIDSSHEKGRLEHLRLTIFGGDTYSRAYREALRRLARSFLITKSISCTGSSIDLREIGREEKELRAAWELKFHCRKAPNVTPRLQEIIQSLWPSTSETVTWNFAWKSFPLEVNGSQDGR